MVVWGNGVSFRLRHLMLFLVCTAIITAAVWRLGEFRMVGAFAAGAFSFPLLPSPSIVMVLLAYVAAACFGVQSVLAGRLESMEVPLFLAGYAMLPAALGRCDLGHLMMASPALLLGITAIEARGALRRVWSPMAVGLVVLPMFAAGTLIALAQDQRLKHQRRGEDVARVTRGAGPRCPVIYRSFSVAPKPSETSAEVCLDTGYYYRTTDVLTQAAVRGLMGELRSAPERPLLLLNKPLADQFRSTEVNPNILYLLELSPWVPKARNKPFDYQEFVDAVACDYAPAGEPMGEFRVWYPKSAQRMAEAVQTRCKGRRLSRRN
jgi:hypothetical protein